jgi:hypothetical protein
MLITWTLSFLHPPQLIPRLLLHTGLMMALKARRLKGMRLLLLKVALPLLLTPAAAGVVSG